MDEVRLNWSTATVEKAKLIVGLEGKLPSGWKKSFERTVRLLGGGEWGKVQVKKRTVRVDEVGPGAEDKLRHHLESVVEQANSAHRADEDEAHAREDGRPTGDDPDSQMTERFRRFGEEDGGAEAQ